MTVQAAEEMWSKTRMKFSSPDGRRQRIQITKAFTVVTDVDDSIEDVLTAQDLPQMSDLYEGSTQIRVVDIDPLTISPIYYMVMVNYEGETTGDANWTTSDPVNVPPTIRWRNLITEEEIDEDVEGNPIATANGERVRGITERVVDWVADVERNYAFGAFDLPTIHEYLRSVNSDPVDTNLGTFNPGVARLTRFEPVEVFSEDIGGYVKVRAEVTFRYPYNTTAEKAWWKRYLHEGYIMRVRDNGAPADGSEDRLINILDDNKGARKRPLVLDPDGFPIPDPEAAVESGTEIYREQETLIKLPYAALGLF